LAGTLYIVGTPIGNLEDVTMRALRVLREVDLIAAEDTRRTARLLQHYSIATPTTSLHEHNEHARAGGLIARLRGGASIALVSDAGMPLVSDPGALLVKAARAAGIPVRVVPGPSAVTAVLAGAGISGGFAFLGFPPRSGKARQAWLDKIGHITIDLPVVFFEAPHRVAQTMAAIANKLGNRPIVAARELTKIHEILVEQPIFAWLREREGGRQELGEHVIVVLPVGQEPHERPSDEELADLLGRMIENGEVKPKEAAKQLAARYGLSASEVYDLHIRRCK